MGMGHNEVSAQRNRLKIKVLTKNIYKVESLSYKTLSVKPADVTKQWFIIDATDAVLGRLASQVAKILRGKHKPSFSPNVDCGDNVIIINAEKVRFTGAKMSDKVYVRHTNYPGGQRFSSPESMLNRKPEFVIEHAVKGMLPKNRLGAEIFRSLKVYAGTEHPHTAQSPKSINIKEIL